MQSGQRHVDPAGNGFLPVICTGENGDLWLAWHEGTGSQMRVKLMLRSTSQETAAMGSIVDSD